MKKVYESIISAAKTGFSDKKRFVLTVISIAIATFLFVFIQTIMTVPLDIDFVSYRDFPVDSILINNSYNIDKNVFNDYRGDAFYYTNVSDPILYRLEQEAISNQVNITTYGVQSNFLDFPIINCQQSNALESTSLLYGRSFSEYDMVFKNKVMIIDESSANLIFGEQNPLGKNINISYDNNQDVFTIIGVIKNTQSTYSNFLVNQESLSSFDSHISIQGYIPITVTEYFGLNIYSTYIIRSEYSTDSIEDLMHKYINEFDFSIYTYSNHYETYLENSEIKDSFVTIIQGLIVIMSIISLFVSQQFLLKSRVFEIGIKKAIGAEEFDILFQFQIESLITSFIGTLIGIILSIYISTILIFYVYFKSGAKLISLDYLILIKYMMILILVSMFSTFIPSYKASRQNILVSLRID